MAKEVGVRGIMVTTLVIMGAILTLLISTAVIQEYRNDVRDLQIEADQLQSTIEDVEQSTILTFGLGLQTMLTAYYEDGSCASGLETQRAGILDARQHLVCGDEEPLNLPLRQGYAGPDQETRILFHEPGAQSEGILLVRSHGPYTAYLEVDPRNLLLDTSERTEFRVELFLLSGDTVLQADPTNQDRVGFSLFGWRPSNETSWSGRSFQTPESLAWRTIQVGNSNLELAIGIDDSAQDRALLATLAWQLAAVLFVITATTMLGRWLLTARISEPVEQLIDQLGTATETFFVSRTSAKEAHALATALTQARSRVSRAFAERDRKELDLQQTNHQLRQMAAVASHDLQEPVKKINAFSTILEDAIRNKDWDEVEDTHQRLQRAGLRLQALIQDILAYAQVDDRPLQIEHHDGQTWMRATLDDVVLPRTPTLGALPILPVDESFRSVIRNLVTNAYKYHPNPENAQVSIHAEDHEHDIELVVTDDGEGIPEAYHTRAFEMFRRLPNATRTDGTGIGLALAKRIVERHGGQIWIDPKHTQGTRFRIRIPKVQP